MVAIMGATKDLASSLAGVSVLLQLILALQTPVHTSADIFSNNVIPSCEDGCHCFGSEGNCPSFPTVAENTIPMYRGLNLTNTMDIICDPFLATTCVPGFVEGEACVVDLIPESSGASCPGEYTYRLRTVPSLVNATAEGQYITHTGACGTCSSLEDLALMIEYPDLPYKAQQCFFRSTAVKYVDTAVTCYEEIGFTKSCATTLAYHQKRIVDKGCGYQCAAWSFDGDLGKPSCEDASGCGACVDDIGISARLELMAGRTFATSGYPSQRARQCSDIAPLDVIGGSDVCSLAPLAQFPTEAPVGSTVPSMPPVVSTTSSPTTEPVVLPTVAPAGNPPTDVTTSPVAPTADPLPTSAPVPSLTLDQCLQSAALEVRSNSVSGGSGVFCDCSDAELGLTNEPQCYSSPDRDDGSRCARKFQTCDNVNNKCCSGSCKSGKCRTSNIRNKDTLRISSTHGGAGGRNDRGNN